MHQYLETHVLLSLLIRGWCGQLLASYRVMSFFPPVFLVSRTQDTCTGFLLGGVGEMDPKRRPNFLVVNKGWLSFNPITPCILAPIFAMAQYAPVCVYPV